MGIGLEGQAQGAKRPEETEHPQPAIDYLPGLIDSWRSVVCNPERLGFKQLGLFTPAPTGCRQRGRNRTMVRVPDDNFVRPCVVIVRAGPITLVDADINIISARIQNQTADFDRNSPRSGKHRQFETGAFRARVVTRPPILVKDGYAEDRGPQSV